MNAAPVVRGYLPVAAGDLAISVRSRVALRDDEVRTLVYYKGLFPRLQV